MVILNGMLLSIEWNLTNKMALQWDLTKKKHHLPKEFTMRIQPLDYWCLFGVCPAQQSWMKQNWCSKNLNVIMQRRDWQVIYDRCLSICNYDKLYSYTADISTINVVPVYIDHFLNGGDTLWICWKSRETNHKGRTQGSSLAKTFFCGFYSRVNGLNGEQWGLKAVQSMFFFQILWQTWRWGRDSWQAFCKFLGLSLFLCISINEVPQ